jgi:Holliday junction resolvase-like predicted endonuclease
MVGESVPARRAASSLPFGGWQAADELLSFARAADDSASDSLKESLDMSNLAFGPLADPLAIDFGVHRWLFSKREEAYSDWLGWILEQIGDSDQVLKLFEVRDENLLQECAPEKLIIRREFPIPHGRLDLLIKFGERLVLIVEIKTKSFDKVAVLEELNRFALWAQKQSRASRCYFVAIESGEFVCPASFEPLSWSELALRMRQQASDWIQASKKPPLNGNNLIRAAMTLAFCGAIEQNLLKLSGKPVIFRTLHSAEYLKEWSRKREE